MPLIAGLLLLSSAYAPAGHALTLHLNAVMEQALQSSVDLKSSGLDIDISRQGIREARSEYFPKLSSTLSTEHNHDFTQTAPTVRSIGSTVTVNNTLYQDAVSLQLSYTLLDFGARRHRVTYAVKDVAAKEATQLKTQKEIKLKLIELYLNALLAQEELRSKQTALSVREELLMLKKRLFEASVISKIEMAEEAVQTAQTLSDIDELRERFRNALLELSFYTQEPYNSQETELAPFTPVAITTDIEHLDYTRTPEYRLAQLEIEKKKEELKTLQSQRLPSVSLYSNYYLYGSNPNRYASAVRDFGARNIVTGINTTVPVFDGFKISANVARLKLEIQKLELDQKKKLMEERYRLQRIMENGDGYTQEIVRKQELVNESTEKLALVNQLTDQRVVDRTVYLVEQLTVISRGFELEKVQLMKLAAMHSLTVISQELM